MNDALIDALLQNVGFAALFIVLFTWTLRENTRREERYLSLLDCYGKQLEHIAITLSQIEERIERKEN